MLVSLLSFVLLVEGLTDNERVPDDAGSLLDLASLHEHGDGHDVYVEHVVLHLFDIIIDAQHLLAQVDDVLVEGFDQLRQRLAHLDPEDIDDLADVGVPLQKLFEHHDVVRMNLLGVEAFQLFGDALLLDFTGCVLKRRVKAVIAGRPHLPG